jgi:hypothetical protein
MNHSVSWSVVQLKITRSVSARSMAGYSGRPLAKKLGIKTASRIHVVDTPEEYRKLLAPLPDEVEFVASVGATTDLVHVFSMKKVQLARALRSIRKKMRADASVWVSWPKKAARVPTDLTEDVIRQVALPLGFVDVKVCAIDDVWSGLKLVVRKALR